MIHFLNDIILYSQLIEAKRQELDSELASRAVNIAYDRAKRGRKIMADFMSISVKDIARLEPKAVLAICPIMRPEVSDMVATTLRVPTFFIYGENDFHQGAR